MTRQLATALACALFAGAVVAHAGADSLPAERLSQRHDDAVIDWSAGLVRAPGVAAGDLSAPSAAVARVGAERDAASRARARLRQVADALPLAGGQTVGEVAAAQPPVRSRLERAVARARADNVVYSTDGSVRLSVALPVEAIRAAVIGASPPPADLAGPTAVIVDASATGASPAVGWQLRAGAERYRGPTVLYTSAVAAAGDPRLGPRVERLVATGATDGALQIADSAADQVARLRKAGALVVVVLRGSGK